MVPAAGGPTELLPRLVASFCQLAGEAADSSCPKSAEQGAAGDVGAALSLAVASQKPGLAESLLGESPEARAQVQQWLNACCSPCAALSLPGLARLRLLNSLLDSRAALVSPAGRVTLADIAVFATVHSDVDCLPLFDRLQMPHLMRWLDLVQTLTQADEVGLRRIPVALTPFQPSEPES